LKSNLDIIYKIGGLYLITVLIIFSSCDNKDYNYMSGELTDMTTGEPIANAKVEFDITEILSGSFHSSFEPFLETYTDDDGKYLFEFESRNFVKIRLSFSADGYHDVTTTFDPSNVGSDYEVDEIMPKESYINVKVHNSFPNLADDVLKFRIMDINEECTVCCGSDYRYFNGKLIDTTFLCKVVGGEYVTINYISIHDGISNIVENQVYCTPGDTVMYNCYY